MDDQRDRRRKILEQNVARYAIEGYLVQSQGDRMARLIKPTSRSGCLLVLLVLLSWPAAIIYYIASGDRQVLIRVNSDLSVTTTTSGGFSKTTWWVVGIVIVLLGLVVLAYLATR